MNITKLSLFITLFLMPSIIWSATTTTPTIAGTYVSVTVTNAVGSSGEKFSPQLLKANQNKVLYVPCVGQSITFGKIGSSTGILVDTPLDDQIAIKITGTNTNREYDLYAFIVNIGATGLVNDIQNTQFYVFSRYQAFSTSISPNLHGLEIIPRAQSKDLLPADMLLQKNDFLVPAINENIFGGNFKIDGYQLPMGTWMAVAILADSTKINFDDPTTWVAWDMAPIVFQVPWRTTVNVITAGHQRYCE